MKSDLTVRRMSLKFPFQGLQLPVVMVVFCSCGDDKRLFVGAAIEPIDAFMQVVKKISDWIEQPQYVVVTILLDYMDRANFDIDFPPSDAGDDDDIPF